MENEQNKNKVTEIFVSTKDPVTSESVPEIGAPQPKSMGAIIGSIIIIIILIIGGLYLWGKQMTEKETQSSLTPEQILSETDPVLNSLKNQGVSDRVTDIEADLNATDLNDLDKELENIDTELSL